MRERLTAKAAVPAVLLTLMTAVLAIAPGAAASSPPPAVLDDFSPTGVVPGEWSPVGHPIPVHRSVGSSGGCDGTARLWERPDGVQLFLAWAQCDQDRADRLAVEYAKARSALPQDWLARSALARHADLVRQPQDGRVSRIWLQDRIEISLIAECGPLPVDGCAALTAPAAQFLSGRLPGTPVADSGFPAAGKLMGALVAGWVILVGFRILAVFVGRDHFDPGDRDPRLHRVDEAAGRLRPTRNGRWWGLLLAGLAVAWGLVTIGVYIQQPGLAALSSTMWTIGLAGTAMLLLRRYPRTASRLPDPPLTPAHEVPSEPSSAPTGTNGEHPADSDKPPSRAKRASLSALLLLLLTVLSLAVPLGALALWYLAGLSADNNDLSQILAGVLIASVAAGYWIDRGAQRLRARRAQEALDHDKRRLLLYLRNFGDDRQRIPAGRPTRRGAWQRATAWLNPVRTARLEEATAPALAHHGPLIAIAPPDDGLQRLAPDLGAARTTLPDKHWKDHVEEWARQARAVIVSATPSQIRPGLRWELRMLDTRIAHGRILLVLGSADKATLSQRFGAFLQTVERRRLFGPLAEGWVTDGVLVLLHVPAHGWGTWYGWGARHRNAWTYTAAVEAAMAFAAIEWAKPAVPDDPIAGLSLTESLTTALNTAADTASRTGQAVDTRVLLEALIAADDQGRWDRILLETGGPTAISASARDKDGPAGCWRGTPLTAPAATALQTAAWVSVRHQMMPVPISAVVVGLLASHAGAVASVWVPDRARWRRVFALVQEDLVGTDHPDLAELLYEPPEEDEPPAPASDGRPRQRKWRDPAW